MKLIELTVITVTSENYNCSLLSFLVNVFSISSGDLLIQIFLSKSMID